MASKLNYSTRLCNRQNDAITAEIGPAGRLTLYSNATAQPASAETAVPSGSVVLAAWTLGSPFAPPSNNRVLTATMPAGINGAANGVPGWYRITTSAGVGVIDGSAGVGPGNDMNLSANVVAGKPLDIQSWSFTNPNYGR